MDLRLRPLGMFTGMTITAYCREILCACMMKEGNRITNKCLGNNNRHEGGQFQRHNIPLKIRYWSVDFILISNL